MADHKIGTRAEWQAARDELAKLEAEHAQREAELKRMRLDLPWVPVEKEYQFETETGPRTLAELFEGRSHLLVAYKRLLERTPKGADDAEPRAWRKDEYPDLIGAPR